MGYDAARDFNAAHPGKKRWCFVCEGPLDAGRLGPPAVAVCGKFFSEEQAGLLADAFDVLIVVPDNDAAGSKLPEYVAHWIGATRRVVVVNPPAYCKDSGEMTSTETQLFRVGAMEKAGVL
jgi:DNA primase